MNLPVLIDVALGLVMVFVIMATLGSHLAELWSGYCKWRHQQLHLTINKLLGKTMSAAFWCHPLINPLSSKPPAKEDDPLASTLSKSISTATRWAGNNRVSKFFRPNQATAPAYLEGELFAKVVLDLVGQQGELGRIPNSLEGWKYALDKLHGNQSGLNVCLQALLRQVPSDTTDCAATLKTGLISWYNEAMTRTSGVYRRKMQLSLFFIGLGLSLLLNVDAVRIAYVLYQNPKLTAQVVEQAKALSISGSGQPAVEGEGAMDMRQQLQLDLGQLRDLTKVGFPIGWMPEGKDNYIYLTPPKPSEGTAPPLPAEPSNYSYLAKIAGLLASTLAVCLGAPFWFDLLGRLVKLRSSAGSEAEKKATGAASSDAPKVGVASQTDPNAKPFPTALDALRQPGQAFCPARAYWLAEFSNIAYESEADVTEWLKKNGFKLADVKGTGETQLIVAQADGVVVVAFRGTEKKVDDWRTDGNLVRLNWEGKPPSGQANEILVHTGFLTSYRSIEPQLTAFLKGLQGQATPAIIHLTGHSLGGALATVTAHALDIENKKPKKEPKPGEKPEPTIPRVHTIHTFGSPRVGNEAFTSNFNRIHAGRAYRVVNNEDIVTRLPTRTMGYDHVNDMIYLDASGKIQRDIGYWYRFLSLLTIAMKDYKEAAITSFRDHGIALYSGYLKKAAESGDSPRI